jgi:hypothetical protein
LFEGFSAGTLWAHVLLKIYSRTNSYPSSKKL